MFLEKYKDKVIQFSSSMPLISPYDLKYNIYLLTKYYPELVKDTYPWNEIEDYDKLIYLTYHKVKNKTFLRRCFNGYYCYSNCCRSEEESIKNLKKYFRDKNIFEFKNNSSSESDINERKNSFPRIEKRKRKQRRRRNISMSAMV